MQILACLRKFLHQFFSSDEPAELMVGVSGGADSMVLLWGLHELQADFSYQLFPVHLNYRLHDRAGEAAELVRSWATDHGLDCVSATVVQPDKLSESAGSLEAKARKLRYDFFQSAGNTLDTSNLFLAHHRDDQVETVLLNVGRGSGLYGLQGMSAHSRRCGLEIHRPFLELARSQIREVAQNHKLPFVEDPTNNSLEPARNRLRHEVLPAWSAAQPDPVRAIYNLSRRANRENEFWEEYLGENFKFWSWPGEIQVDVESFNREKPAAQLRLLHSLFSSLAGRQLLSEQNLTDVSALFAADQSGNVVHLPAEFRARREYDRVALYREAAEQKTPNVRLGEVPTEVSWPGGTVRVSDGAEQVPQNLSSRVQQEALTGGRLRTWETGDRLKYEGRPRKIKEIFQSNRIPYRARRSWPLLVVEGEPVVLPGLAVKDGFSRENGVIIKFLPEHPKFAQVSEVTGSSSK